LKGQENIEIDTVEDDWIQIETKRRVKIRIDTVYYTTTTKTTTTT